MTAITTPTRDSTTRVGRFVAYDPSGTVRGLTASLLGMWPKGTTAKNRTVQKNRERIMWGGMLNPVDVLYRMSLAAIDEGKDGIQWAKDLVASLEKYKARHERQGSGLLPFPERHLRIAMRAEREDSEADVARMQIKAGCIASLEKARAERLDAIAEFENEVEALTAEIAELRAGGR